MALPIGGWGTGLPGPAGTNGLNGDPGPAPAGTGLVEVVDGVLGVPSTLAARLAADSAALRTALDVPSTSALNSLISGLASLLPLCPYATCDGPLTAVGRLRFDPALFAVPGCTLAVALEAVGDVSAGGLTGTVVLYDLTANAPAATISVTSTTPGNAQAVSVTVPGTPRSYELRASLSGGAGYLTLGGAVLRLTWS